MSWRNTLNKTGDVQLGMMVDIVKEYGNEIPGIIKAIKNKHIESDEKEKAEIIFSTVHRCKGMEYDAIQLVNDFINEEKIEKLKADPKAALNAAKLNEEINLLYVAVTRTKNSIHIHEDLLPKDFPKSSQIHIQRSLPKETIPPKNTAPSEIKSKKKNGAYSVSEARETYRAAYASWTEELDGKLTELYCMGISVKDMAKQFGRTKGAIASRIRKLGLEEKY